MGYEEYSREEYRAECACGKGYTRYYKKYMYNDWGQTKEKTTTVEIMCEQCNEKYRYEQIDDIDYLVFNGISVIDSAKERCEKEAPTIEERYVGEYSLEQMEEMLIDMKAHTYLKQLENKNAIRFSDSRYWYTGKKSLKPMREYLQNLIDNYDELKIKVEKKKINYAKSQEKEKIFKNNSKMLEFRCVEKQHSETHRNVQAEKYLFVKNNDNQKNIEYIPVDLTCEKDFTGLYWDTYYIKECIGERCRITEEHFFTTTNKMVKRYSCVCTLCDDKTELFSTDFKIEKDDERGYYSVPCCNCHTPSSAEAKTMDILNKLGVIYMREKSFEDLQGEFGGELRFDFAFYKKCDENGNPKIDLVIELQGPHHYKPGIYDEYGDYITEDLTIEQKAKAEEKFAYQQRKDQKKQDYCKNNGIAIECINLETKSDYEYLKKKIIKILDKNNYEYWD